MNAKIKPSAPEKPVRPRDKTAAHRFLLASRFGEVTRTVRVRIRTDHRHPRLQPLADPLHDRGRGQGHDPRRRPGTASHQPPEFREAAGRHLFRAQHRGYPCCVVFGQETAWNETGPNSTKRGKEVFLTVSEDGAALCGRYRDVREACLLPGFTGRDEENLKLGEIAQLLRTLSGRYDQAARAASSY